MTDITLNDKTVDYVEQPAPVPKKRGRKPNPNKQKMYFSDREEDAFKEYCKCTDDTHKNKLFNEILYPAFTKMVESIIRRYTLFTPGEEFSDTFNDAMSHLISKVGHFDPDKNKKAYSYCGTICKNYVLHKRQKAQESMQKNISYDMAYNDLHPDLRITNETPMSELSFPQTVMARASEEIVKMIGEPLKYKLNETDVKVGGALVNILNNWDDIFCDFNSKKYNKSSIDSFIKESTYLTTKQIRDSKKKFSIVYVKLKEQLLNED